MPTKRGAAWPLYPENGYGQLMSTTILSQRKIMDSRLAAPNHSEFEELHARIASLEGELRRMREEFAKLRELFLEREKKGTMLTDAYKSVLSDMAELIEAQRHENTKREESLRFFLGSIESRLKTEIRSELGIESRTEFEDDDGATGWWPFRSAR